MKLAIVVGHNPVARGAVSVDGTTEFDWNSKLAHFIREHDEKNIKIFYRSPAGGYSREIDRVYKETDDWGADLTVELHFNGASQASANGCLTLTSGTENSMILAQEVHKQTLKVMESRDRGIEVRKRHDRGGRSLWQGKAPAIMTEPFFGSNPEEWRKAQARIDQLAEAVYRGARDAYRKIKA